MNHDRAPHLATRAARIMARCDRLAACTEEPGAITRPYGSAALVRAMALVEGWMREAGLETRRDAVGNLLGRRPASVPDAPVLVLGSHLDSVRDAGRYDGPLGVLVALEAVGQVAASGQRRSITLEVAIFADEEGLRFQTAYLGSSGYAGSFDPPHLDLVDSAGVSLRDACTAAGGDPDQLQAGVPRPTGLVGYVEVHIEQGPALERLGAPLAIVSAIAGQSRIAVTFTGEAGHAGTVAMGARRDALLGAAELALAAEALAFALPDLVATVGELAVFPGASNVIPGRTRLSLDIRAPDDRTRETAVETLHRRARAIAAKRGLDLTWHAS
ncbi:MAG: hydantoinase/carbamoylase family amidase, partial [Chloroflexia bacterium]|nr:hydantoinase/carbamoylase family amidase [Chloroflexia bacterium]